MMRIFKKVQHQILHYHVLADIVDPKSTARLNSYRNLMSPEKICTVLTFGIRPVIALVIFNALNSCFLQDSNKRDCCGKKRMRIKEER